MKVILLEDMEALGMAGEIVTVKDGYARNYLVPKKKAIPATESNLKRLDQMKKRWEARQLKAKHDAERLKERMESLSLTLQRRAGDNEKLFGSVTSMDIERALNEEGISIDRKKILLEEPIKKLGIYQVPVRLHPEVTAQIKVWVVKA
jgi:large subunit ribosomal protein L9